MGVVILTIKMTTLAELAEQIFYSLKKLRKSPKSFSRVVKRNLDCYGNHNLYLREGLLPFKTVEGRESAENLVKELRSIKYLSEVSYSSGLSSAAQKIADKVSKLGPVSSEKTAKIINKFGFWYGELYQLVDEGSFSGNEVIQSLLLDDGIEDKTNKRALLNAGVEVIGVGCALSQDFGTVAVILLAENFKDRPNAKEVKTPSEPLPKFLAFDKWDEDAIKLDCEIAHLGAGENMTIKVKQIWRMHDNTVKVTEKVIENYLS